ncbi:MAG: heme ABC transporter permease CcmB [Dehalococcoidales bacterium]|jgi:heme exporter protein B|nr:heme ABC transporter permease CcmB [Dehalococcoidales bacterium]MDP6577420.1 heme exporter protein CcmB [Dehalococcoidales bacterium]|tara:strand:- start:500 stop:1171 length:672 start_codon:yes stop_codon:yes gene_type:complete
MKFWNQVISITWKDTFSEIRTREVISSVLVFTLLVIVIFNFAFGANQETLRLVAPGILWVTFTFTGVLSLNRAFIPEKEQGCLEGLMACPISREAIYVGKMLASLLFMLIIEAIALPVFAFLFNLPVLTLPMVTITILATIGFVAVGTLFSALAINTRAREMVLPILFLPVMVPVIISAVNASKMALSGKPWNELASWIQIIGVFDVIFLVVSCLIFTYAIEE